MRRFGGSMVLALIVSAACAAPALAHSRDHDGSKEGGVSLSIGAGPVKVAAEVRVPGSGQPEATVSASTPDVSVSTVVDSSAPSVSVEASTPVVSGSVAVESSSAPVVGLETPIPPTAVPALPVRRPPLRVSAPAEPRAVAPTPARHETVAPAPAPVVAASAPAPEAPQAHARRPVVRHATPLQMRDSAARATGRKHSPLQTSAVSVEHSSSPLHVPPRAVSPPATARNTVFRPARWLVVASDLFGRSVAGLGAGSAAVLLFALVAALSSAAPRRGLWPRPHADLAPQPALASLLERPG